MNKERLQELEAIGNELVQWAEDEEAVIESMKNATVFTPDISSMPLAQSLRIELERGRPHLSTHRQGSSPKVQFRISEDLNQLLEARSQEENKSKSEIIREALAHYLVAA